MANCNYSAIKLIYRRFKVKNVQAIDVLKYSKNAVGTVSYSNTALTHWFFIEGIATGKVEELKQHLWSANLGNGDVNLYAFNESRLQLSYETTDSYEYREDFAYELVDKLGDSVINFLAKDM